MPRINMALVCPVHPTCSYYVLILMSLSQPCPLPVELCSDLSHSSAQLTLPSPMCEFFNLPMTHPQSLQAPTARDVTLLSLPVPRPVTQVDKCHEVDLMKKTSNLDRLQSSHLQVKWYRVTSKVSFISGMMTLCILLCKIFILFFKDRLHCITHIT